MTKAKDQAFRIAHDLGIGQKPPFLRTLDCVGLVQDGDEKRFGFLFQLPLQVDVDTGPISLRSYLGKARLGDNVPLPLPTLGDRIRLARSLAYTLAELHFAGILHRDIHSGNVLLFFDRTTRCLRIGEPYVGGFSISRPEHDESLSLSTSRDPFDDFKHPELREPSGSATAGNRRHTSRRRHDIYSLGLVLLEIGIWKQISSLPRAESAVGTAKKLLRIARLNLPHHMGPVYSDVVADCIDIQNPWRPSAPSGPDSVGGEATRAEDDDSTHEFLMLFVQKVVVRLEGCHCQT